MLISEKKDKSHLKQVVYSETNGESEEKRNLRTKKLRGKSTKGYRNNERRRESKIRGKIMLQS